MSAALTPCRLLFELGLFLDIYEYPTAAPLKIKTRILAFKNFPRASELARQVKVLAAKPEVLMQASEHNWRKERTDPHKLPSDLHPHLHSDVFQAHSCTLTFTRDT